MEVERLKGLNRCGTAEKSTLGDVADLPALVDPASSALDRLASCTRITLKMQHVKQKLDSVLVSRHAAGSRFGLLGYLEMDGISQFS